MKHFVSILVLSMVVFGANAAPQQHSSRNSVQGKMIMSAPRYTASVNQLNGANNIVSVSSETVTTTATKTEEEEEIDMREAERNACVNNNIGIGNTFVWASRFSDTSNYANMIEDVTNPQNNVCFVRVELKSDDESRISVSDIAPKYFMWGETIECGSWANEKDMEKRILEARKGARIGGIVASTVGGAGLGVGAMELFGNKLIGGKVQGQKSDKQEDKIVYYKAHLKSLQTSNPSEYNDVINNLKTLKRAHEANMTVQDYDTVYRYLIDEFVR